MSAEAHVIRLSPHPSTPNATVRSVEVSARLQEGTLSLTYELQGDIAAIRVPAIGAPALADGLWQHTCFEAFVAAEVVGPYHELNFAPSRQWAAYAFERYRVRKPFAAEAVAPEITTRKDADRLILEARVILDRLSPAYARAAFRLGIAAVVESADGTLDYWALLHPPGKPDFHHPDTFALRIGSQD